MSPGRAYYLLRHHLRGGPQAALARTLIQPRLLQAPPHQPHPDTPHHPAEIHMLVCHSDWLDGLWGLHSWHLANPSIRFDLVLHEDGSVPNQALAAFTHLFPHIRLIRRIDADTTVNALLAHHPRCLALRSSNPYSLKLFDIPLLATPDRQVIVLDADILFFNPCTDLLQSAADPLAPTRWNRDWREGYSIPFDRLSTLSGLKVPDRINSGLGTFLPESVDLDRVEQWLEIPGITEHPYPGRVEQTLVALCASAWHQGFEFLPPPYDVHMGKHTPPDAPCRHYTGSVRYRMHAEGLPRIARTPHR
jgi:hypothetical protein